MVSGCELLKEGGLGGDKIKIEHIDEYFLVEGRGYFKSNRGKLPKSICETPILEKKRYI